MSRTQETLPPFAREILEEILEELQTAEPDAYDKAAEKCPGDAPFAYVAGYVGAIAKCQAARLERLLAYYEPKKDGAA